MPSFKTLFTFSQASYPQVDADVLIVPVYFQKTLLLDGELKKLDASLQGILKMTCKEEKFEGKKDQLLVFRKTPADSLQPRRVIWAGLGDEDKAAPLKIEKAIVKATETALKLENLQKIAIALPTLQGTLSDETLLISLIDGVTQATYHSQEAKEPGATLPEVVFLTNAKRAQKLEPSLCIATSMAHARSFAKDLVNKPANLKTTQTLVEAAKALEKDGLTVSIQDDVRWITANMPSFYAVARGSVASDPPKFITVNYKPKKGKGLRKVALVGKSVIFDTGGYQVKPGDSMVTMKGDMTGGAMVLATLKALAELKPEGVEVTAYLAATPNKIDSDAMLPDSIVDSTCGKKIEIRHTDAEGRLTLIDAVAKASEQKPDVIVTTATLTGSAMRAVGLAIALMSNDETWRNKFQQAAQSLGDPCQSLDVIEEDYEDIKSKLDGADIINTSKNKNRGAQSAAAFVMSGVPDGIPVVHLDIAGADMTNDEKATGIGQKALIQFVLNQAKTTAI